MSFEIKYKVVETWIEGGSDGGVAVGANRSTVSQVSEVVRTIDAKLYAEILDSPHLEYFTVRKIKDKKSEQK